MISIVNYGIGNLTSILNMFKKIGVDAYLCESEDCIKKAKKILLPGMGHFDNCMDKFNQSGLRDIIEQKVLVDKIPVLGICVGLQMFMKNSEEGKMDGLGWIKGETIRFKKERMNADLKIPNMGWLEIKKEKNSPLLSGLEGARFYFAHSYHVSLEDNADMLCSARYGYDFTVGIERDNILGVQFHPEKSHRFGMQLLKNFAEHY